MKTAKDRTNTRERAGAALAATRSYTPEARAKIHQQVCALVEGGHSTVAACKEVGVARSTWTDWLREGTVSSDSYARARELGADALAEGIIEIADNTSLDPHDRRVRIDARKWVAARLYPKRWGDRVEVTSDGAPVVLSPVVVLPAFTDEPARTGSQRPPRTV